MKSKLLQELWNAYASGDSDITEATYRNYPNLVRNQFQIISGSNY